MSNVLQIVLILLLALAIAAVILLSGCVSESGAASPPAAGGAQPGGSFDAQYGQPEARGAAQGQQGNGSGMQRRGYNGTIMRGAQNGTGWQGNMTQEQREQMEQQRISACEGKTEGDSCQLALQEGMPQMSGTCQSMNGALSCGFARGMGGRQQPPS